MNACLTVHSLIVVGGHASVGVVDGARGKVGVPVVTLPHLGHLLQGRETPVRLQQAGVRDSTTCTLTVQQHTFIFLCEGKTKQIQTEDIKAMNKNS